MAKAPRQSLRAPLTLCAAMFCFSVMAVLAKLASKEVPPVEVVLFRGIVGVPILMAMAARQKISLAGKRKLLLLARGAAGTIAVLLLFYALSLISVADAMLLNQLAPVFVLPLAARFLGERLSWRHFVLVGAALLGAALIINPTGGGLALGGLLAFGSAAFAGTAYVLVRKLTETERSLTVVFWFTAFSAISTLPFAAPVFVAPTLFGWLVLGGVGLMSMIGQLLLTNAYRHGEASRLAIVGSTSAVFGAGWDAILFGHAPGWTTLTGGGLVIAACAALQAQRPALKASAAAGAANTL